jgi:hypothetical protein
MSFFLAGPLVFLPKTLLFLHQQQPAQASVFCKLLAFSVLVISRWRAVSGKREIGRGMIGSGMGRKAFIFIPMPNIPLPINPLL